MKTVNSFKFALLLPVCFLALVLVPFSGNFASATITPEASFSIDVTYFINYTPPSSPKPSNMSDNIFVGTSSAPFAKTHAIIPLTNNGLPIIDLDSTDNVPGLHITRKLGYVEVAAYGANAKASREDVKADFSFTNATLLKTGNDPLHAYEKQGNGSCGIVVGHPRQSTGDDQIRVSGNSGSLCSTTTTDSDIVRIYYVVSSQNPNPNPNPIQIACNANSDCGTNGYIGSNFCNSNGDVYRTFRTWTCNNAGTSSSTCAASDADQLQLDCSNSQTCNNGSCVNTIPSQNGVCSSNSNCGPNGFTGNSFCQDGDVYRNFTAYNCNNPGTAQSFCSSANSRQLIQECGTNQTCHNGSCVAAEDEPNCAENATRRCFDNNAYWYDSCGNRGDLIQDCSYNQTCQSGYCQNNQDNNCTQNSYQRCVGNYLYWYDSCGNRDGLSQYCSYGCSNNYCLNQNTNTNISANVTVKNLTNGSGWSSSGTANPSDVLMFMITIQPQGNQSTNNIFVRDIMPYGLSYRDNMVVSGASNYTGDITSGINIGAVYAGQTVTITYQAQVAPSTSFSYGTTTLTSNVSVTASGSTPYVNNATISVYRTQVYGVTNVPTGLTNNFLADSFFLPLALSLLGLWMFRSGIFGVEKWADTKRNSARNYRAQKELNARIAKIREAEKI